jgi:hypothetical protein
MKMPISNDMRTGSSRLQPIYFEPTDDVLREIAEAEFLTQPAEDKQLRMLEQRWQTWLRQKDKLDADFRRQSLARVAAAAKEINADRLKAALEQEEEKRLAYFQSDAEENAKYVAALTAAIKKQAADRISAWRTEAEAHLRRATASINADIVAKERKLFGVRKRR